VRFDVAYPQPDGLQVGHIARDRLRIRNARHPGDQPPELRWQVAVAFEIAQTEAPARSENAGNLGRGGVFVRKRTERAFAHHRVEGFVRNSTQLLRVGLHELDLLGEPLLPGGSAGQCHIAGTIVNPGYLAAKHTRQVQRGCAATAGQIKHPGLSVQT
jgi:hypothetical protein